MKSVRFLVLVALSITAARQSGVAADAPAADAIERDWQPQIQPLLKRYCFECHSGDRTEAEIDLAGFKTVADVRRQVKVWSKVRGMLDTGQMPPKDALQPTDAEKERLRKWVREFLTQEAAARAGDPGPVVLRRLTNAEYNYTVRDLTGVESLDPTREFPVDGAAGEGFTNTGAAQGMSPSLARKYLDAAKDVASHAVLTPDGIRFSEHTTRRDHTDELLARIQSFYGRFTSDGGGEVVNLQGVKFDTNQGGLLPLKEYIAATLEERNALASGAKSIAVVAGERSLNARYLETLWDVLTRDEANEASYLLAGLRKKWRSAQPDDAAALVAEIEALQKTLWKFNTVGQIAPGGASKSWMDAVTPIATRREFRTKPPESPVGNGPVGNEVVFSLAAGDVGDGREQDFVVWERPRIEYKSGHPAVLLKDVRALTKRIENTIAAETPRTKQYLDVVHELHSLNRQPQATKKGKEPLKPADVRNKIAETKKLNPKLLEKWSELCGLERRANREITGLLTKKSTRVHGYENVNGWSDGQAVSMTTNRATEPVSFLTLTVPARGVVMHPSPTHDAVAAWRSPIDGRVRIEGLVADADNKCGNGAAWRVEHRSAKGTAVAAQGVIDNGGRHDVQTKDAIDVRKDGVVSLIVNARDAEHVCDTTHIELKLTEVCGKRVWSLTADVVDNVLKGNPLPDAYGHSDVWHFCSLPSSPQVETAVPPGSALAHWRTAVIEAKPADEIARLAENVERIAQHKGDESLSDADKQLQRQLKKWTGPLDWVACAGEFDVSTEDGWGVDPARFGARPDGVAADSESLCVHAPEVVEVRLPAGLIEGAEFVTAAALHADAGKDGSVEVDVVVGREGSASLAPSAPVIAGVGGAARVRVEAAMKEFRELFPTALCYARIVPVDEVVTLTLFHREDHHLKRLMLDDAQAAELDRLWDELYFVSREPIKLTVAHEQITEFATQDRPDLAGVFAALKKPINDRADAFRQRLKQTEPVHVESVLKLADLAWRRTLTAAESQELREFYRRLRDGEIPHENAIELTLARVVTSPAFLYRLEQPARGESSAPVSDEELAARLSYFLWSSLPDEELRTAAAENRLTGSRRRRTDAGNSHDEDLLHQTQRMLKDPRTRRLAVHFACQWLHIRGFDQNAEKNEKLYPRFAEQRGAMYEESVRFFENLFRSNGSILDVFDADHTFVNERMAALYGIDGVKGGEWRRVSSMRSRGRGGILGMAVVLSSQSGASRTSPILRGNWVSETLLGERLPRPPAGVPVLPETVPEGLTARQLIERHSSVPACAKCHARIDPYGFALEQFDAIGRMRPIAVDVKTNLIDGRRIEGLDGLRKYLSRDRREDVMRQFCRKLLGYALGRELQLSDEPLLDEMMQKLKADGYRFHTAVETIVMSKQFRMIRPDTRDASNK